MGIMNDNRKAIFTELAPPPHGLERFRERLTQETGTPHAHVRYLAFGAASLLICFALITLLYGPFAPSRDIAQNQGLARLREEFDPAMIRLGLAHMPSEPVTIPADQRRNIAVQRVPIPDSDVIYYRICSIKTDRDPESDF